MASIQSERVKGVQAALKMGVPKADIADHLARLQGVDIGAARSAGATDDDIIAELVTVPGKPVDPYASALEKTPVGKRGLVNIGAGMKSLVTGARQIAGTSTQSDANDIAASEYLQTQPGGTIGRIVGQSVPFAAVPAGLAGQALGRTLQGAGMAGRALPGAGQIVRAGTAVAASPMTDAAIVGAGTGALIPASSSGERATNIAVGSAVGPAAGIVARGIGGAAEIVRAGLKPEQVAAKGLIAAATDPARLRAMQGAGEIVPGSVPTTAAMTGDAGLLAMEREMRSSNVGQFAPIDEAAAMARREALASVAKTPEALAQARAARQANEAMFYSQSLPQVSVTPDAELVSFLKTDAGKEAVRSAQKIASNMRMPFAAGGKFSGTDLQLIKMGFDDAAQKAASKMTPSGQNMARSVDDLRKQFVAHLDATIPGYQSARQQYAAASQPIREMEAGQQVQEAIQRSGGRVATGVEAPSAMQFERAVRAADAGDYGSNFSPEAKSVLDAIAADLRRSELVNAKNVRGLGSDTYQKFASQNVASKVLGGNTELARRVQNLPMFAGRNDEVSQMMVRAIADPKYAKYIISQLPTAKDQSAMMSLIRGAAKSAAIAGGASAAAQVRN